MTRLLAASLTIARRDFVATVWSRSFILFLLAPLLALGLGLLMGHVTDDADRDARRPVVAVAMADQDAARLWRARSRITAAIGEGAFPDLVRAPTEAAARLSGSLGAPRLEGPSATIAAVAPSLRLLIADARRAGVAAGEAPVVIAMRPIAVPAADRPALRRDLARGGQLLVFFLTMILAGMMLSNLVEEKSSKVIEVLAAAVPLDAIFLGKLAAMLGVSLVAASAWGALAAGGWVLLAGHGGAAAAAAPAVGWPVFAVLAVLYFTTNYLLLGALFLGIGGQAGSVREVQTLSMPVTFAQVGIFFLASIAVAGPDRPAGLAAAAFPFSSPLTMIARAAQADALWPHLAALAWQCLWIAIVVRLAAGLFRRRVLKSGPAPRLFSRRRAG